MRNKLDVRTLTYLAVITAVTLVLSLLIIIPVPATNGFVTILDAGIYCAGLAFGSLGGGVVGGLTGLLIDIISGYTIWAPFSLVIHGLQGLVYGLIIEKYGNDNKSMLFALAIAGLIMVGGYAVANEFLYGGGVGWVSIPSNIVQVGFGSVVVMLVKNKFLSILKVYSH